MYRSRQPDHCLAEQYRSSFYTELWHDAANAVGAAVKALGSNILEIQSGGVYTRVRHNTTAIDDPLTLAVAGNKPLVYRLLAKRGLRVPEYFEFKLTDVAKAVEFVRRRGGEWVVKPAHGAGGHGVTTGVSNEFDVIRAAVAAAAYEPTLLVERQVEGGIYRLLYLDGSLLDVVLRKRPKVVADGKSSVRKLIESENRARLQAGHTRAQVLVSIDMDVRRTLAKQGLSLSSVPKSGTIVTLKTVINENSAVDNVVADVCKSIVQDAAAAVSAVGARLAAVDIVTQDPSLPLTQSGGVILEVNTTPGYHCHYHREGTGCPVAVHVLSAIFGLSHRPQQPPPRADVVLQCASVEKQE